MPSIKYVRNKSFKFPPPPPVSTCTLSNTLFPFIHTHFQYWLCDSTQYSYLLQWNVFNSTFNRFFYKIEIKRTMQRLRCQLFYLITGAILCSKFNYSDVKLLKPWLPLTCPFFFFLEKIFTNGKYTVKMRTYSLDLNPLPLCAPARFPHESPSRFPTCIRTLWMTFYCVRCKLFITHVGFFESTWKTKVRVSEYFCNGLFTKTDL